jgi:alpha/beta superfamily hydrolase
MVFPGRGSAQTVHIAGEAGAIETLIEEPAGAPRGIALVAHPHPLFGGTFDNKVVQTLARTFNELGYVAVRPNFRGVGASQGEHDKGQGETTDMLGVLQHVRQHYGNLPVVLAGFSFGAYVQTRVAAQLAAAGTPAERIVLVAPAVGRVTADRSYDPAAVPADTIIIHGDQDGTVPLANVQEWAGRQQLPVLVVEGSDHFFHRRLGDIKTLIRERWH